MKKSLAFGGFPVWRLLQNPKVVRTDRSDLNEQPQSCQDRSCAAGSDISGHVLERRAGAHHKAGQEEDCGVQLPVDALMGKSSKVRAEIASAENTVTFSRRCSSS